MSFLPCQAIQQVNITTVTVGLKSVPKNTAKYAQIGSPHHALASADSLNKVKNPVLSHDAHAGMQYATGRAIAAHTAVSSEKAAGEKRSVFYTAAAELRAIKTS